MVHSEYAIHVGGSFGSADVQIDDIINISINSNASSMSDFSATIPKQTSLRERLQDSVYIVDTDDSEVVWYGTLETWEEQETGAETVIGGRGPLLEDKQSTIETTFNSVFADDALDTFRANSALDYEFITEDRKFRVKDTTITNDGAGTTGTVENQVTIPANLSDEDIETGDLLDWDIYVKYNEQITSSTVGISDTSGSADETTTVNESAQEYGHFELTVANDTTEPYIFVDIPNNSTEIEHIVAIVSSSSQRYIISEEINGNILEGTQRLAELAGYEFSPQNYDSSTNTFIMFPIGYRVGSPNWRILDASRASDFAGYANEVTVRGSFNDSLGRYNKATISDADEISAVGKTITRYEKRVDLTSDSACRSVAKTLLSSAIQNRGESGDITTTVPPADADVIVGADTPIFVWSTSFNDGGLTGADALDVQYNGTTTPRVSADTDFPNTSDDYYLKLNVFAELDNASSESTILSTANKPNLLTVEPDGTIKALPSAHKDATTDDDDEPLQPAESAQNTIQNRVTQTVEYYWTNSTQTLKVDVDGNTVISETYSVSFDIEGTLGSPDTFYVGNRIRNSLEDYAFRYFNDTGAIITFDSQTYDSNNEEYTVFGDNTAGSVASVVDTNALSEVSADNAAYREGVSTDSASNNITVSTSGNVHDIGSTNFAVGLWVYGDWAGGDDMNYLIKGGTDNTTEGWQLRILSGVPELNVSNGTTQVTYTLNDGSSLPSNEWVHIGAVINNTTGVVEGYVDGAQQNVETYDFQGESIETSQDLNILNATSNSSGDIRVDEVYLWKNRLINGDEFETLSSLGPQYDDNFVGGVDEFEYRDGDDVGTLEVNWKFDDDETPNTALDSTGNSRTATISGIEYAAVRAPIDELSYSLGSEAEVDVSFDIQGRVDTELTRLQTNIENTKD